MTALALTAGPGDRRSPFDGVDVCAEAGFHLPPGRRGPRFEDDVWDLTEVVGLPVEMPLSRRRLDFTAIANPAWQLVAKELMVALLVPRHEAVAVLPRAWRTPLHLRTCQGRLAELTSLLNWLSASGVTSLGEVRDVHCEAYLADRHYVRDATGEAVGELGPATRRAAVQAVVDLVNYRELFSVERVDAGLRPWRGASASAVAGMRSGRDENKTPPLGDTVLRPMLAAALYLTGTLGPLAAALADEAREATRARRGLPAPGRLPAEQFSLALGRHTRDGVPLPLLPESELRARLARGWAPEDPLLAVSLHALANEAGIRQFKREWLSLVRGPIETALDRVGTAKPWGRHADLVPAAGGDDHLAWTLPLHGIEVVALAGVVRSACIIVIAALSGMRSSELMELLVGCRRPPEQFAPGLARYRVASKVVKGQPLGGVPDEWVVIEPVHQAVGLAERLLDNADEGAALFGRFAFPVRYAWFRAWVNGPAGQRLGLGPIPEDDVSLRALRRTLAVELAYRPGGVLATKVHLKHISVATTEGYASRPGGAQAALLAEINEHEQQRNLNLVLAEFHNYRRGVLPAGPGARELTRFFAGVDAALPQDPEAPKVQGNDREVLALLTRRAGALHLGVANYCWFTDPSRALCLKLAGTPDAKAPLAGMCDSARCPQATHHPCHREVWATRAATTQALLVSLGPTRRTERARLQADHDRARRVLAGIDTRTSSTTSGK
ncbi:MAG: site-specific integrase [Acidimicrobiales bacterium]